MYNGQLSARLHLKAATTSGQGLVHPWQIAAALLGMAGPSGQTPSDARFMVRSGALKVSLNTAMASVVQRSGSKSNFVLAGPRRLEQCSKPWLADDSSMGFYYLNLYTSNHPIEESLKAYKPTSRME